MPKKPQAIPPDWNRFTENLAQVLGDLDPGECLIISSRSVNTYVQFAVNEDRSIRAEAASNEYIEEPKAKLTAQDERTLVGLGWQPGSANFILDLPNPVDYQGLATLAVATLRSVYRIGQLSELNYHSFHDEGRRIRLPSLGLDPRPADGTEDPIGAPPTAVILPARKRAAKKRPKLPPPLELPPAIQKSADDLLMRFDGATRIAGGLGFKPLTAWLDENFDELGLGEWDHDTPTPIIPTNETYPLSDSGLLEKLDRDLDESSITDEMRIAHLDRHLAGLITGKIERDADSHPACGFAVIRSTLGRQAVIGYGLQGYGFGGSDIEWYGMFAKPEDIWQHLRQRGWLFDLKDLRKLSRAAKLKLWDR